MAKLTYTKICNNGTGRYDLMVNHKVKELIDGLGIASLLVFQHEWNHWSAAQPKRNAFHFWNAYRLKVEKGVGQIWKHFSGSDRDPVLIYEIREEVSNV
ncbi:hypothetical protein C943_03278 [Mariniradius saccharolyticus AK6]|uniref:Uncharacterized protein n=1 Tax=Mariniradius saccharolyticus AK6 TaxID=1239962 RepID=M7YBM5_9BACT|nr:hypothetical protein [Mariniradius saccharolyticus]EMS34591.1 hypothetical protein C943_03278 [Mariniradius saccharolyticus AK6]